MTRTPRRIILVLSLLAAVAAGAWWVQRAYAYVEAPMSLGAVPICT